MAPSFMGFLLACDSDIDCGGNTEQIHSFVTAVAGSRAMVWYGAWRLPRQYALEPPSLPFSYPHRDYLHQICIAALVDLIQLSRPCRSVATMRASLARIVNACISHWNAAVRSQHPEILNRIITEYAATSIPNHTPQPHRVSNANLYLNL